MLQLNYPLYYCINMALLQNAFSKKKGTEQFTSDLRFPEKSKEAVKAVEKINEQSKELASKQIGRAHV